MNAPGLASAPPFADARHKIGAYLRLCGLEPAVADRLAASFVESLTGGRTERVDAAVAGTLDRIDTWAGALVEARDGEGPAHRAARGRAVMFLAGLPVRWPEAFLATAQPPGLQAALAGRALELTPALRQTTMTPQPLDLGPVSKVADETWRTFDKWPFLRGLTIWALFFALLGAAFYLVRF